MTLLDPSDFNPDDERLSRFLDDDLDVDDRDALEHELAERPELQTRMAVLHAAARWTADSTVELSTEEGESMLAAALGAFDAQRLDTDEPGTGDADDHSSAVVVPMGLRRARTRRWSPSLIGLSAAALVLIAAVAALARGGTSQGDMASESATAAEGTLAFEVEREVDEGLSTKAGAAADATAAVEADRPASNDASLAAENTEPTPADLGDFPTVESLIDAVAGRSGGAGVAGSPTTTAAGAPAPTTSTAGAAATTTTPSTAAVAGSSTMTIDVAAVALCPPELVGTASIDGRAVRWAELGGGSAADPRRVVVVDAMTCAVLKEQAI